MSPEARPITLCCHCHLMLNYCLSTPIGQHERIFYSCHSSYWRPIWPRLRRLLQLPIHIRTHASLLVPPRTHKRLKIPPHVDSDTLGRATCPHFSLDFEIESYLILVLLLQFQSSSSYFQWISRFNCSNSSTKTSAPRP